MRKSYVLLIIGIGAVASAIGYMVGGSATPVVSIAIPAIFGVIVSAFGLLNKGSVQKDLLTLATQTTDADIRKSIDRLLRDGELLPTRIGVGLIVFTIFYLAGTIVGSLARTHDFFAPEFEPALFPWAKENKPPATLEDAVGWIALAQQLKSAGYSDDQISELYKLPAGDSLAKADGPVDLSTTADHSKATEGTTKGSATSIPIVVGPKGPGGSPFEHRILTDWNKLGAQIRDVKILRLEPSIRRPATLLKAGSAELQPKADGRQ